MDFSLSPLAVVSQRRQNDLPFGDKIFILLGDFRQTCPVIRGGTKNQVIDASIKSSPLWKLFQIRCLLQPFRNAEDPLFAQFVDAIGDGAGPEVSLEGLDIVTEPDDLIDFVYPLQVLSDSTACLKRAILAPTNMQVDHYNNIILNRLDGAERLYMVPRLPR